MDKKHIRRLSGQKMFKFSGVDTLMLADRDVTRTLIGGYIFIYPCSARRVSFQIDQFEFDLKRYSSGRTLIYEYTPSPLINVLVTSPLLLTTVHFEDVYLIYRKLYSVLYEVKN